MPLRRLLLVTLMSLYAATEARAQTGVAVPSAEEQIAAALLPLPTALREGAGINGYDPSLHLIELRAPSNSMMCMADDPRDDVFDVRCYDRDFLKVIRWYRKLRQDGMTEVAADAQLRRDAGQGKVTIPDHPTAGYRMEGPITAYDTGTHTAGPAIDKWQSVHFPYRTAAEIGLPTEPEGTMPYVMASGTWWSHVMIVHQPQ